MDAAGVEQVIGAADVGVEGRDRRARRDADQRLRAEVDHHVHFPDTHRALDRGIVLERSEDLLDLVDVAAPHQLGLRIDVHQERDDRRAPLEQRLYDPRADDAGGAGDQDAPAAPDEGVASYGPPQIRLRPVRHVPIELAFIERPRRLLERELRVRPQEIVHSGDRVVVAP